jgi:hypothetical protein
MAAAYHQELIADALRRAQALLWANLPPARTLTDDKIIYNLRTLVRSRHVKAALRKSDSCVAFALRAVERVLADDLKTNRAIIGELRRILDDPALNEVLGLDQNNRVALFWRGRRLARPQPDKPKDNQ